MKRGYFFLVFLFYMTVVNAQSADSSFIFLKKGQEERSKRLYMVAFNDLQKSLQYKPDNIDASRELGLAALDMRKYDIAKDAFLKVAQNLKNDTTAVINLALLNFWTRQWQQATQFAEQAQQLHAGKNWNYIIGKSFYEEEDYGQAFKYLQAAAEEDSSNAEIPYMQARGFVDMNNYKAAIPFFKKAIALDSTRAQWMYECALTCATIYDDKTAIKFYELAALKGYKKDNDFYENLSDSYIAAGQPEKGLELMLLVLQKKPADLDLLYSIANTYYKIKKYDSAIDYWDKILFFDKENYKALYMIGLSYQKKGDTAKGRQLCDKAIELDPSLKNLKTEKKMDM
jgi:tetratricopeptide (TPR) repeat protein